MAFLKMPWFSWFLFRFRVRGGRRIQYAIFSLIKTRLPITAPPRTGNAEQELGTCERFSQPYGLSIVKNAS